MGRSFAMFAFADLLDDCQSVVVSHLDLASRFSLQVACRAFYDRPAYSVWKRPRFEMTTQFYRIHEDAARHGYVGILELLLPHVLQLLRQAMLVDDGRRRLPALSRRRILLALFHGPLFGRALSSIRNSDDLQAIWDRDYPTTDALRRVFDSDFGAALGSCPNADHIEHHLRIMLSPDRVRGAWRVARLDPRRIVSYLRGDSGVPLGTYVPVPDWEVLGLSVVLDALTTTTYARLCAVLEYLRTARTPGVAALDRLVLHVLAEREDRRFLTTYLLITAPDLYYAIDWTYLHWNNTPAIPRALATRGHVAFLDAAPPSGGDDNTLWTWAWILFDMDACGGRDLVFAYLLCTWGKYHSLPQTLKELLQRFVPDVAPRDILEARWTTTADFSAYPDFDARLSTQLPQHYARLTRYAPRSFLSYSWPPRDSTSIGDCSKTGS